MDNDIKIKNEKNRHQEVLLFLQNELEPLKRKNLNATYDLEKEYAKTKKNKSPFVVLVLTSCLLAIALLAFILSKNIERKNREIKVNVSEFSELNLMSLLESASRVQEQYEDSVKKKAQLVRQKNNEITSAQDKRDGELLTISSMHYDDKKLENQKIAQVQETYKNTLNDINEKYQPLYAEADEAIERNKAKVDALDASKLSDSKNMAVDSSKILQELEKKQLVQQYENRILTLENNITDVRKTYNEEMKSSLKRVSDKFQAEIDALDPVIVDAYAEKLFESPGMNEKTAVKAEENAAFAEGSVSEGELKTRLSEVKQMYADHKYLEKRVLEIPYKNQAGKYIQKNSLLVNKITDSLADTVYGQYQENLSLQTQMEQMQKEHEEEVSRLTEENNRLIEGQYDILYRSMEGAGTGAIIAEKPVSKDEIYVLIRPDARFLLGENEEKGCNAEIPFKKPIKGSVEKTEDGRYRFIPEMKNGKYVDFDLGALKFGVQVKLN
ncbi:MAG: hypothetical protein HUK25_07685 [Treponema sp.]|nr:hypothetical protein [Treponema sp.]